MTDFRPIGFNSNLNNHSIKRTAKKSNETNNQPEVKLETKELGNKALEYLDALSSFHGIKKAEVKNAQKVNGVSDLEMDRISKSMADFEVMFGKRTNQVNTALKEIPGSENLSDNARMYLVSECVHKLDMPGTSLDEYEL